jgi:hypothetical protein
MADAERGTAAAQQPPSPLPAPPPPPPELVPAESAFARGDFRAARALTDQLLSAHPSPEIEAAARALQARMAVDPWAFRIALAAAGVLAVIIGAYVL